MIMKMCKRCNKLIAYPRVYCQECQMVIDQQREMDSIDSYKKHRGRGRGRAPRDPKYRKFYKSKQWKDLSKSYMIKHQYRCEVCGSIASEVHHIEAIQTPAGWNKRLDYNNLKAVCVRCHNEEHNRFKSRNKPFKR